MDLFITQTASGQRVLSLVGTLLSARGSLVSVEQFPILLYPEFVLRQRDGKLCFDLFMVYKFQVIYFHFFVCKIIILVKFG